MSCLNESANSAGQASTIEPASATAESKSHSEETSNTQTGRAKDRPSFNMEGVNSEHILSSSIEHVGVDFVPHVTSSAPKKDFSLCLVPYFLEFTGYFRYAVISSMDQKEFTQVFVKHFLFGRAWRQHYVWAILGGAYNAFLKQYGYDHDRTLPVYHQYLTDLRTKFNAWFIKERLTTLQEKPGGLGSDYVLEWQGRFRLLQDKYGDGWKDYLYMIVDMGELGTFAEEYVPLFKTVEEMKRIYCSYINGNACQPKGSPNPGTPVVELNGKEMVIWVAQKKGYGGMHSVPNTERAWNPAPAALIGQPNVTALLRNCTFSTLKERIEEVGGTLKFKNILTGKEVPVESVMTKSDWLDLNITRRYEPIEEDWVEMEARRDEQMQEDIDRMREFME